MQSNLNQPLAGEAFLNAFFKLIIKIVLEIAKKWFTFSLIRLFSLPDNHHALNGHASNIDATLPPYTISNTVNNRPSVVQRSIRSVQSIHSQSLRKHANRSSTRSTKSHRSARRKHGSTQLPSYSSNYPTGGQNGYSTASNPFNTLNSNSHNYNGGSHYNTYKSIKSYGSNHHSNAYNSKQYNSTTQLQPDSSSVDSLTLYGAQNQGYYESKYSLHKSDKEPPQQSTSQSYAPNTQQPMNSMQRAQHHDYYEAMPTSNYHHGNNNSSMSNNNSMNNNYEANNIQSNYYSQTPYQKSHTPASQNNNNQDSIYNVYSSNPYNTYGRSTTRHQQRPSSFSCTSSCNSLMDNMITNNPNGGGQYASHPFDNVRGSPREPLYMNRLDSETRI